MHSCRRYRTVLARYQSPYYDATYEVRGTVVVTGIRMLDRKTRPKISFVGSGIVRCSFWTNKSEKFCFILMRIRVGILFRLKLSCDVSRMVILAPVRTVL